MTDEERQALADLIRSKREALGISSRELARRAGVDQALLTLIDQKKIAEPKVATIRGLAAALDIPLADIYAATNWLPEGALPSLRPYMRAKYDELPEEAVEAVERYIARLSRKHQAGPRAGEDESN
ncbi:MAG: transcriptional regulator [Bacteroidetes bacterium]|nr:transcriptional regulator [Bacteroidota bacterium]